MAGILDEARKRMTNGGRTDIYGNPVAPGGITNYRLPKLYHDIPEVKPEDPVTGQCGPGYRWDPARQTCVLVDRDQAEAAQERSYLGHETPAVLRVGDTDHRVLTTDYGDDQLRDGGRMGYGGNYIIDQNGEIVPLIDDTGNLTEDGLRIVELANSGVGIDYTTGHHIQDIIANTGLGRIINTISGGALDLPDERDPASGTLTGAFTSADIPTGIVRSDIDVNNDGVIDELDHIFVSQREAQSGLHTDRIEGNPEVGYTYQGQHYDTFEEAKAARDGTRGGITGAASTNKAVAAVAAALGVAKAVVQNIAEATGISDPQQLAQAVQESGGAAPAASSSAPVSAGLGQLFGQTAGPASTATSFNPRNAGNFAQDSGGNIVDLGGSDSQARSSARAAVARDDYNQGSARVNESGGVTTTHTTSSGREYERTQNPGGGTTFSTRDGSGGYIVGNTGGPAYLAHGGFPGQPKGHDTVPAWLTEGEYVTNKPATEMFGDKIEQYNNIGRQVQDPNVTVNGGMFEAMHELDRLIHLANGGE